MRVVAGRWGGRKLRAAPAAGVRPTPERAREAVFNILYGIGLPSGATVVDCFAGSGAMGIEALSRGAAHVTFVDNDPRACATIEANLADLMGSHHERRVPAANQPGTVAANEATVSSADGDETVSIGTAEVRCADALSYLATSQRRFDLLLADPPFAGPFTTSDWPALLAACGAQVAVAEWHEPVQCSRSSAPARTSAALSENSLLPEWSVHRSRRYGAVHVTVLTRSGSCPAAPSSERAGSHIEAVFNPQEHEPTTPATTLSS